MRECEHCKKPLNKRHRRFCSAHCKGKFSGRLGGLKRSLALRNQVECTCLRCSIIFTRPPSKAKNAKYCSQKCKNVEFLANAAKSYKDNFRWKDGICWYHKMRKEACEHCQGNKNLHVHHINGDRHDNRVENLQTLCSSCHRKEHYRIAKLEKGSTLSYVHEQLVMTFS